MDTESYAYGNRRSDRELRKCFPAIRLVENERGQMTTERVIEIPWMLMQLPQSGTILDVGSCDATYLADIPQPGRTLHCLDPRNSNILLPPGVVWHNQNIIGNDLPRQLYDAAVMVSVLEHIGLPVYGQTPFPNGDELALAEVWELLKPGAPLIVTVPAGQLKASTWYRQYNPERLRQLFRDWQAAFYYWGCDGTGYHPIIEAEVEEYDYREYPFMTGAGAGALAGIIAYHD